MRFWKQKIWKFWGNSSNRRVLASRAASNLLLAQRIEFVAYPRWNSTPNGWHNLSVPMSDRINTIWKNINVFRLLYQTFAEYYWVERPQNCFWLNESKLLRTLCKIPPQMCGRTYVYQCQAVIMWCHKKSTIFVCFTRLSQSTTESSGHLVYVG